MLVTGRLGYIYQEIMDMWITLAYRVLNSLPLYPIYRGLRRFPSINGHWPSNPDANASALFGTAFKPGFKKSLAFALFGAVAPGGYVLGLTGGGIFTQLAND